MGTRERVVDQGSQKARAACLAFGEELRRARTTRGMSQALVGSLVGLSDVQVGRVERGQIPGLSVANAFRLGSVVGLDLTMKAYPSGVRVFDAGHLRLLDRIERSLAPEGRWRREVSLPEPGDKRAWDLVLELPARRLAVEGETRLGDVQALQRRVLLKLRDDPTVDVLVLPVADTRHNRLVLREFGDVLRRDFPLDGPAVRRPLAAGHVPPANALVVV